MSEPIIRVENISKQYKIGARQEPYGSLRESLVNTFTAPFKRLAGQAPTPTENIWALKDVSFEVQQGEVVGIIGRNGAGKSTLLKILSRITKPTTGRAILRGRVASLLEVGTGFHPELTGRENIYLNGAILGMHRHEIERKFDEIVDFAEIEKFLDTPVKRYSSGMYVRLAFAVAAHLEPEILLVDEVLAVGDAAFQKKCLGKMGEVARGGRTVLFVSHNMAAVQNLCKTAILLKQGLMTIKSATEFVINSYLDQIHELHQIPLAIRKDRTGNGSARVTNLDWHPMNLISGNSCKFILEIESLFDDQIEIGIGINTLENHPLLLFYSGHVVEKICINSGKNIVECYIPDLPLAFGKYSVNICLQKGQDILDWIKEATHIEVQALDFFGKGKMPEMGQVPIWSRHYWSLINGQDT